MAKKWTEAERKAASIAGKKRWAARKKQDVRQFDVVAPTVSYGGAKAMSGGALKEEIAIDIVAMLRNEAIPSPLLLKVVERILRP